MWQVFWILHFSLFFSSNVAESCKGSVPVWPPEVNHFAERVAASLPLHSYDIFCAMLLMLAFAKSRSELLYPDALIAWWYMSKLKLLLNPQSLKRLSACIDAWRMFLDNFRVRNWTQSHTLQRSKLVPISSMGIAYLPTFGWSLW